MTAKISHPSDEELLLAADGELDPRRADAMNRHLQACPQCRTRTEDLKAAIVEFVSLHHAMLDSRIPSTESSRNACKTQLSKLAHSPAHKPRWQISHPTFSAKKSLWAAAALLVLGLSTAVAWHRLPIWLSPDEEVGRDASLPDRILTPGSVRAVSLADVCSARPYEQSRVMSLSLKQKVLREYGMPANAAADHEIDFLVIPELGGAEDIHNLWPEPYATTTWNAHVKDELEERLHQLVCEQKIDLQTAQRDIATNWISAYKKYFHTNKPIPTNANS